MISQHSAHSTPQPFGIRTWLWRYTCLLLLISMLWHRQAIFESKGDKLSSSAECRIRTHQGLRHFLCWMQDSNPRSQTPNRQQTEYSLTNRLYACILTYIHTYMSVVVNIDGQAIFESKGDKLPYSDETRAPSQYPIRRIIVRSREVLKPRDLYLELSDRSEISRTLRQHCCRCACQISKWYTTISSTNLVASRLHEILR